MTSPDRSPLYCVIGAGPSGLSVCKNLRQAGIPFECLESEDDVGGNWYFGKPSSSVYRSTHMISSKRLTEYPDFPMPRDFPPYPSHEQALAYLRSYARHFELYDQIRLNSRVQRVEPAGNGWLVQVEGAERREYAGLVIANGHHWDPLYPEFPGEFQGEILHARQYKSPERFAGKRVLVVGAGNSGCDIAVDATATAARVLHSMRRGYYFLPKFLFGKPIDVCGDGPRRWGLPLWARRAWALALLRVAVGPNRRYGLPEPDHKLFETHPIINSQLLYHVGHGRIAVRPQIERLCGDRVQFVDGSCEQVDTIVYATGYKLSFPFLDANLLLDQRGQPRLFLHAFHPERDNLFVAGLIQPNSGQWWLTDLQARLMASFIVAQAQDPPRAAWFRRLKAGGPTRLDGGIRFTESQRHVLEVDYADYSRKLRWILKKMRAS